MMVRTTSDIYTRSQGHSPIHSWLSTIVVIFLLCLPQLVASQACNTDQNPYCKGNSKFEALCCPYPNVCYWSDRDGTPGCCPAGQVCLNDGGSGGYASYPPSPRPQPTTITSTVTRTTTGQNTGRTVTTTIGGGGGGGGGAVIVVITTVTQSQQGQSSLATTTVTRSQQQGQTTTTAGGGVVSGISQTVASAVSTGIGVLLVDGAAEQVMPAKLFLAVSAVLLVIFGIWELG